MGGLTNLQWATVVILGVTTAGLIAWDSYAMAKGGLPATITGLIQRNRMAQVALALAFGLLCGHLFL